MPKGECSISVDPISEPSSYLHKFRCVCVMFCFFFLCPHWLHADFVLIRRGKWRRSKGKSGFFQKKKKKQFSGWICGVSNRLHSVDSELQLVLYSSSGSKLLLLLELNGESMFFYSWSSIANLCSIWLNRFVLKLSSLLSKSAINCDILLAEQF